LDIETLSPGRFTDVDPIGMISCSCRETKVVLVADGEAIPGFGEGWAIQVCAGEADLLRKLGELIRELDPDVFVGYNSNKFDIPRILKRSRILGVPADFSRLLNEDVRFMDVLNENKQKGTIRNTLIDCPGRILFDACVFVRGELYNSPWLTRVSYGEPPLLQAQGCCRGE